MLILIKFIKNKTDFAGLSSKVVNLIQRLTKSNWLQERQTEIDIRMRKPEADVIDWDLESRTCEQSKWRCSGMLNEFEPLALNVAAIF